MNDMTLITSAVSMMEELRRMMCMIHTSMGEGAKAEPPIIQALM
jgi:hypothetical protein